ncbi:uncharacterized protein [Nicotiana tomentosiformis]|uniref:uncharacterized protein n=1 Tax=Nicotiana tomentosiformis TaxID=4098 RepID=UPI00388C4770
MAPYEPLYGRQCQSLVCWFELGEARLLGTNLVQDALEKVQLIQDRLRMAQSRQKCYADRKVRDVAYMVGEKVLLRVSLIKGVMRFEKKGKLSPRYIGPFEVVERSGEVACKLALPPILWSVHPVFHVSLLWKYFCDLSHVLDIGTVRLDGDLTYYVESVAILDRQARKLRSKNINSVKMQWRGQLVEEATWDTEREMQRTYPHIFEIPSFQIGVHSSHLSFGEQCNES